MKAEDPKQEKLRAERFKADIRLDTLVQGYAKILSGVGSRFPEDLSSILEQMLLYLPPAVEEALKAQEAYRPYWRRHRPRRISVLKKPKKKAAAVKRRKIQT